jgi:Fur family ferric uptake transcriptional regulator
MKKIDTWLQCLQENGYRLTKPRMVVLQTIARSKRVLNPFEVFELSRKDYPRLGLVTVYRTIEKLVELELVQRVHQPSGCQAYIASFSGHQHLLICNTCGRVEFFSGDQEKISALIDQVASDSNYCIDNHWLQFFGTCQVCQVSH